MSANHDTTPHHIAPQPHGAGLFVEAVPEMTCSLNAARGADLAYAYVFPASFSVSGYTAEMVVYDGLGGDALLTVSATPTVAGSTIAFNGQRLEVRIEADDIDALPVASDPTSPSILQFDIFLTSVDLTEKFSGGPFKVQPYGARAAGIDGDIDVSLGGQDISVQLAGARGANGITLPVSGFVGGLLSSASALAFRQAIGADVAANVNYTPPGSNTYLRTVQERMQDTVSVFDYIPVNLHAGIRNGLNFTDLQPYIQDAIDDVGDVGGGVISFPEGTYRTGGALNINKNGVFLIGSGRQNCRLTGGTSAFDCFHFGGVATGTFRGGVIGFQIDNYRTGVWLDYGCAGIQVENINFASMVGCVQINGRFNNVTSYDSFLHTISNLEIGSFTQFGIKIYHCGDNFISNVKTVNSNSATATALIVDSGTTALHVWDCNFAGCKQGVHIRNSITITPNPNNLVERPSQCFFTNVLGDTSSDYAWYVQNGQQMSFVGCWAAGTQGGLGYGFYIGTDVCQLEFVAPHILGNHADGMRVVGPNQDARITITGGYVYGNGFAAPNTLDGITIEPGVKGVVISGIQAYDDSYPRRSYSGTWDPPSLANGASATTVVSVPGVTTAWRRVYANLSTMPVTTPATWTCYGEVTAPDEVTITLTNNSGATFNVPSGALSAAVLDPRSNGFEKTQRYGVNLFPDQLAGSAKTISGITKANPGVVSAAGHSFANNQDIFITGVGGMVEVSGYYTVVLINKDSFSLKDAVTGAAIDTTGFTTYTSGGTAQQYDMTDKIVVTGCNLSGNSTGGIRARTGMRGVNMQIGLNLPAAGNDTIRVGGGAALSSLPTVAATWDPVSLVDGAVEAHSITVPGAAINDRVVAALSSITTGGWLISGTVTTANTVAVTIMNKTGAPVDLPSGTLTVTVTKTA